MHLAKDALEITEAKIVYVLIEDIKPGTVLAYPVEAGHLDIDFAGSAI